MLSESFLIAPALRGLRKGAGVVEKTPQAAKLEAHGWEAWLKELFPHVFTKPFAKFQREFWEWFWATLLAIRDGRPLPHGNAFFALWFRGASKSTHAEITPIAEAAHIGSGLDLYLSGNQEMANRHLAVIDEHLRSDPVAYYYPPLSRPMKGVTGATKAWRQEFIYTESGHKIIAVGLDVGVRGLRVGVQRPTLIVPDDVDTREDSTAYSQKKLEKFTHNIIPTKGPRTIFVCAQNLIIEHGVINQIYSGRVRALADAKFSGPHPEALNLVTEEQTINGRIRDVVVSCEPTWPEVFSKERVQADIDDMTLPVFQVECQHDLKAERFGLMLKSYNDNVHVISWEEFETVFKQPAIPRHWTRYGCHDWSATRSDYHACVAAFLAVSSQNSALPGAFFLYESMSFEEGTQADDVAMRIVKSVAPHIGWDALLDSEIVRAQLDQAAKEQEMTRAIERRRRVVAGVVRDRVAEELKANPFVMLHMSHEAKTALSVYRNIYGLPFDPCNPGAAGGVEEMNHFMKVDYKTAHAFRPEQMGYTRFYIIVNQRETLPVGDADAELLRYQFERWRWRPPTLSDSGLLVEKPLKMHDDFGNACMMLFTHFRMQSASLTKKERTEEALPAANQQVNIDQLPDDEKSGAMVKRQMLIKDLEVKEERKNIYDARMRAKLKRRRGR